MFSSEKFWARIDVRGPDECWPWTGHLDKDGYGRAYWNGNSVGAHRIAYWLCFGPTPAGLSVLHACDWPPCCNPRDLFSGTQADNMRDRDTKGRMRSFVGGNNNAAKLTAVQVAEIRVLAETCTAIGAMYGISRQQVARIRDGKSWSK